MLSPRSIHPPLAAAFVLTFLLCWPATVPNVGASKGGGLLGKRTEQSLRERPADLTDNWYNARLLAHFGESRLASDVLARRPESDVIDPEIERFEARMLTEAGRPGRADSVLALQTYTGDGGAFERHCLQRARLNLDARRPERALALLALIDSTENSVFGAHRDFLSMEAFLTQERYEEARLVGEGRLARGIPVSLSPDFEQLMLDTYMAGRQFGKALDLVRVLKKRREGADKLAPVLMSEVDVLLEMGDTLSAAGAAMGYLNDKRTRSHSLDIARNIVLRVGTERFDNEQLLSLCKILLGDSDLEGADRCVMTLSKRNLDREGRERLRLYSGDLYYRERRYSKSYGFVRERFDDPSLERDALLIRARIYRKTGQAVKAADTYAELTRRYPYDAKAAEALLVASDLYLRAADRRKSLETLESVVEIYPSHRFGRVATLQLANYYLERKHYSRGISILERALERTGRTSEELLYYLAVAYDVTGKHDKHAQLMDELRDLDHYSFYLTPDVDPTFTRPIIAADGRVAIEGKRGLLEFLGKVFDKRERAMRAIRASLDPLPDGGGLQSGSPYLIRGREYLQMGFKDWGERELKALEAEAVKNRAPARVWFELGVLYDDYAMHWRSVRAFQRVYYALHRDERRRLESEFDMLLYPLPYPALIVENCARFDMAPHLVYAMMREESRFDYNAVSRAGAMGLMQLMPSTGEQVAGKLGFPDGVDDRLFSPEINLTFGIWYASHLLGRTEGNAPMMLSAYNAGLGNARRWFRRSKDTITSVDGIDYRETRGYVKRIIESAQIYHDHYFDPHTAGSPAP
jgi:soluble lytic murein transglycosylase